MERGALFGLVTYLIFLIPVTIKLKESFEKYFHEDLQFHFRMAAIFLNPTLYDFHSKVCTPDSSMLDRHCNFLGTYVLPESECFCQSKKIPVIGAMKIIR